MAQSGRPSSRGRSNVFAPNFDDETKTPETDFSSSDQDIAHHGPKTSRSQAKKQRKSAHQTQETVPPLRPARDILSRIRHDPLLDVADYVIGYLDRHMPDPMEMDVSDWKGGADVTEEDWIPQHRILYFRRKGDPEWRKVWDRQKRLDRLFGSGISETTDTDSTELSTKTNKVEGNEKKIDGTT